jgi:hypothetical protein
MTVRLQSKEALQGVHEKLCGDSDTVEDRVRYRHIAAMMGCFKLDFRERLLQKPLGQIWRNHLLAGSQQIADGFDDALSVLLFPDSALAHIPNQTSGLRYSSNQASARVQASSAASGS